MPLDHAEKTRAAPSSFEVNFRAIKPASRLPVGILPWEAEGRKVAPCLVAAVDTAWDSTRRPTFPKLWRTADLRCSSAFIISATDPVVAIEGPREKKSTISRPSNLREYALFSTLERVADWSGLPSLKAYRQSFSLQATPERFRQTFLRPGDFCPLPASGSPPARVQHPSFLFPLTTETRSQHSHFVSLYFPTSVESGITATEAHGPIHAQFGPECGLQPFNKGPFGDRDPERGRLAHSRVRSSTCSLGSSHDVRRSSANPQAGPGKTNLSRDHLPLLPGVVGDDAIQALLGIDVAADLARTLCLFSSGILSCCAKRIGHSFPNDHR